MASVVQFSQAQAALAKYWYERIQYTWGPQSLATGTVPVFAVNRINRNASPQWLAEVSGIAATRNANVGIDVAYDGRRLAATATQGKTDALPTGLRSDPDLAFPAVDRLALMLKNDSGAAIAGYQLNYQVAMRRLTALEKAFLGLPMTAEEQEALDRTGVAAHLKEGIKPRPVGEILLNTFRNRFLYPEPVALVHADASTSDSAFLTIRTTMPDTCLVLTSLAVEGGPDVVVSVDRDDDLNYMGVNGAAFAHADDAPWQVWVPALDHFTFHIQATSPVSAVPVRVVVWHVRLSDLIRVRFGLAGRGEVPDDTYFRAIAGVV